jgi:uncharacterized membrane protein
MDLIEMLLGGGNNRRNRDELPGILGAFSKWIFRCGCLLLVLAIMGLVLLVVGIVPVGGNLVTTAIVVVTIIVAVASLIRASLGY